MATNAIPIFLDDVADDIRILYRDGIVANKSAFSRDWVEQLREDMMSAFWEAIQRPGGAVGRGPRRWYVELHPQALRGFADLVSHPWIQAMAEGVLGPDYQIVEVGFDTPFQGRRCSLGIVTFLLRAIRMRITGLPRWQST